MHPASEQGLGRDREEAHVCVVSGHRRQKLEAHFLNPNHLSKWRVGLEGIAAYDAGTLLTSKAAFSFIKHHLRSVPVTSPQKNGRWQMCTWKALKTEIHKLGTDENITCMELLIHSPIFNHMAELCWILVTCDQHNKYNHHSWEAG